MSAETPKFEFVGPPIQWQNDILQDIVEGNRIQVHVSMEALQDAKPELSAAKALEQFAASRDRFMAIALREYKRGNSEDGKVIVKTEHLRRHNNAGIGAEEIAIPKWADRPFDLIPGDTPSTTGLSEPCCLLAPSLNSGRVFVWNNHKCARRAFASGFVSSYKLWRGLH